MTMAARDLSIKKTASVIPFTEHRVQKNDAVCKPEAPQNARAARPPGRMRNAIKKHSHTEDRRTSLTIFERKQPPAPHAV